MSDHTDAHDLADELFDVAYTIEHREFADGDTRTVIKHSVGWSATCYITVQVWVNRDEVWVDYYEGDTRRSRTILDNSEFDPDADLGDYVWPDQ